MRHKVSGRKLGRKTQHRLAMFKNMAASLIMHERIETTLPRAKELRSFADHLITLGKKNDLAARRQSFNFMRSREAVVKLFDTLAPRFADRNGGYTRVLKLGYRLGDSSPMAIIEYLPGTGVHAVPSGDKPKKAAAPKKEKAAKAPKAEKKEKAPKAAKASKEKKSTKKK
ncbi:50S ribosomal protein L17 [bacterium]|nr:50S ribosomal protein L17 [bacterium]